MSSYPSTSQIGLKQASTHETELKIELKLQVTFGFPFVANPSFPSSNLFTGRVAARGFYYEFQFVCSVH